MKDQEAQEYMKKLLAGAANDLEGAEAICFRDWTEVVNNLEQATGLLAQARSEAKRLEGVAQHLTGQREAYFKTLIASEEERRNKKLELVPNEEVPEEERNTS